MDVQSDSWAELFSPAESAEKTRHRLLRLAWRRYRIPRDEAEDVVQTAFAAYLEVRHRYPLASEHGAILVGIFRKKCLTHIDRAVRENRLLRRYCSTADAARENPWIRPCRPAQTRSVLDDLVHRESRGDIRRAILQLHPTSQQLVSLMAWGGLGRKDLIAKLQLNENTLDSRLHACRNQLRLLLRKQSVAC